MYDELGQSDTTPSEAAYYTMQRGCAEIRMLIQGARLHVITRRVCI